MVNEQVSIDIINRFIPIVNKFDYGNNINEKFELSMAIGLFVEKVVSLEKAAELSGKPLSKFIEILQIKKINWAEYTEEHFNQDNIAIAKYKENRE